MVTIKFGSRRKIPILHITKEDVSKYPGINDIMIEKLNALDYTILYDSVTVDGGWFDAFDLATKTITICIDKNEIGKFVPVSITVSNGTIEKSIPLERSNIDIALHCFFGGCKFWIRLGWIDWLRLLEINGLLPADSKPFEIWTIKHI